MINYPPINIRSKNEFIKRVCVGSRLTKRELEFLYETIRKEKDTFWDDHSKASDTDKGKIVRYSFGPLNRLLRIIDKKLLAPYDKFMPPFIHGGLSERDSVKAAIGLMKGSNRSILKFDLKKFFEQIKPSHILLFLEKSGCKGSSFRNFIAYTCCAPLGAKNSNQSNDFRLARGFAPSGRIASWVSYPFCVAIKKLSLKKLKGHDPRVACYFDDIAISASGVSRVQMKELEKEILKLAEKYSININLEKEIIHYSPNEKQEFLGVAKQGNHFFAGAKTKERREEKILLLEDAQTKEVKRAAHQSLRGYSVYSKLIKTVAKT